MRTQFLKLKRKPPGIWKRIPPKNHTERLLTHAEIFWLCTFRSINSSRSSTGNPKASRCKYKTDVGSLMQAAHRSLTQVQILLREMTVQVSSQRLSTHQTIQGVLLILGGNNSVIFWGHLCLKYKQNPKILTHLLQWYTYLLCFLME